MAERGWQPGWRSATCHYRIDHPERLLYDFLSLSQLREPLFYEPSKEKGESQDESGNVIVLGGKGLCKAKEP